MLPQKIMFDIQEYYNENAGNDGESFSLNVSEIEDDIAWDIDQLLKKRFEKLYVTDRYRTESKSIDIIHPTLSYPEKRSLITTSDRVRFILSLFPDKKSLDHIDRIVLRPRYIELNSIELTALYLKKNRILVLYLCHPHMYQAEHLRNPEPARFISVELHNLTGGRFIQANRGNIHPLWYYISTIAAGQASMDETIEKFFVKKTPINDSEYRALIDISYFYTRHGY